MSGFTILQKKRIKNLLLWITILGQASVALYLPSLPTIEKEMLISELQIKQTITLFIIGFGISPIFYGPMSDRYGRKPILIISLIIASIGYIININATTISVFNIARILQGLGCGGILVSGRSIARDVFSGVELASASSYLSMGFAIGFGLSPSIGGFITNNFGWKFDFVFLLTIMLIVILSVLLWLPETIIKKQRELNLISFIYQSIKDYRQICCNIVFLQYLVGGLFAYTVVISYNIMTPFLMQKIFLLSPTQYGFLAICIGVPYYMAASMNKTLVLRFGVKPMFKIGIGLIILAGLLIIVLNYVFVPKMIYCVVPLMLATFGQALVFSNTISGALQEFSSAFGGRVSAIFSGLQMLAVSLISAIIATIPSNNSIPIGMVILILGSLTAIILFNLIFNKN